jgi:hypothetical protein
MTFFYETRSWNSQPQIAQQTIDLWKHITQKKNWRIVQLRETLEGAEQAIDASIAHYSKKLEFVNGPKVVKTFK